MREMRQGWRRTAIALLAWLAGASALAQGTPATEPAAPVQAVPTAEPVTGEVVPVQVVPSAEPAAGETAPVQEAPPPQVVAPDYIIGPGDTLNVFVWRNPELTITVPVRPDGKISTPLVEDMVAVGKTPSELARDIEKVLGEFIRTPSVNVIVTGPTSMFSQIKVIGQVAQPQSVAYREGLTVLDVVLSVGGLTEFASGNRAKLIRKVDGKTVETKVRLDDLVNKGDMKQNLDVKPGDILVVPESFF